MQDSNITKLAEPLLDLFLKTVNDVFKDRVISTFKIGSLGTHGDFSLCSDVDVVLMLDKVETEDYSRIQNILDSIKNSGLLYSDILSIFWSSYNNNDFENEIGRFPPLDRLDFIKHGILLTGIDQRSKLAKPSHKDIVLTSAKFISSYMLTQDKLNELKNNPTEITRKGARYLTKFVLFPVRLIFTLDNPNIIGSNKDSVEHFNNSWKSVIPEATTIVNFAYKNRNSAADEALEINGAKLQLALLQLYKYCISQYEKEILEINGQQPLANQLAKQKQLLNA